MAGRWVSGLKVRVILTYLVIFLVSAAIMAGRAGVLFSAMAMQTAQHDLELQAYLMASALERPWGLRDGEEAFVMPQLQQLTGRFAQGAGGQLNILDTDGNTVATSNNVIPDNQGDAPEVHAALRGAIQHDLRRDQRSGQQMMYAAAPVQRGSRVFAVVQVAAPVSSVVARTRQFWLSMGLTALFAALASAVAGWLLADKLARPVGRLRDAAARLAGGNLSERVPTQSSGGIAEIDELADAFNDMAERIETMIVSQRAFVANASHELRTPLTNIKLRAEALNNGALEDPSVAQKFAREIESEANRLSRMAQDLLNLTRQDAAAPPQARESVDLAGLIGDVVAEMRLRAEMSGVSLTADMEPGLPRLRADPAGLQTVMLNLVDNALQYTPPGGTISVQARRDAGGSVVVQVTDSGAGIPPEDLPHIFDRFYRADKARSRRLAQRGSNGSVLAGSGAGLGLAIVRGIVEEHSGSVTAESQLGRGTTVTVTLPVDEAERATPIPAPVEAADGWESQTSISDTDGGQ